jgi:Zn-dependent protease with chaperone function
MMGGRAVSPDTRDALERRLRNVVEEMAIASGVPVPAIYVLDQEKGINAFAAGFSTEDAAVAVTRGTLETLDRDQLQGVIAHEFSHILNGDMRMNIRLIGVLFGILAIAVVGRIVIAFAGRSRGGDRKDNAAAAFVIAGLALLVIGYIGVFIGRIIQAAVSRQREFLADASAVQFTRNPQGISEALKTIAGWDEGSRIRAPKSVEVGHLLFGQGQPSFFGGLMATHPPLEERIRRLDPNFRPEEAAADGRMAQGVAGAGAAAAGAAGFAGGGAAIRPDGVVDRVGRPTAAHMARGVSMRAAVPEAISCALQTPDGAMQLTYALLLDADPGVRSQQVSYLRTHAGEVATEATLALSLALAGGFDARLRLPLIDLAAPALRKVQPATALEFMSHVEALVVADRQVSLFEFALQRLLGRRLARRRRPVDEARGRPSANDVLALLAALAVAGTPEDAQALTLLRTGAARVPGLDSSKLQQSLATARSSSPATVGPALDRLGRSTFETRRAVLDAACFVVMADGRVTLDEAELLRIVAISLDCPMPPFLETF